MVNHQTFAIARLVQSGAGDFISDQNRLGFSARITDLQAGFVPFFGARKRKTSVENAQQSGNLGHKSKRRLQV